MKFIRIAAAIAALVLVGRAVSRRLRGQLLGMGHPGGLLLAGSGRQSSDEYDASAAVGASWVDEQALLEAATTDAGTGDTGVERSSSTAAGADSNE